MEGAHSRAVAALTVYDMTKRSINRSKIQDLYFS